MFSVELKFNSSIINDSCTSEISLYIHLQQRIAHEQLIHISLKCETIVYPWRLIKFICILYEFQQGRNAFNKEEACRNLLKVFGEGTVSDRTCRRWYEKFETGDFDLSDKPRSGRPSLIDDDVVKAMLEQDPFLITSEIAERLNSAQQIISDYIRKIGLMWKYSRWVPHELSQKNLDDRVVICTSLLARNGG
ncbi:histone-lysine N-methyltransferase SETMAR-like [Apis mellifera carnica]|uniref:Histone-lysine N-methyltransferase SETMAR-like n=1 Tax=Apis mellifera TaxID=7460 RepID=A0A7M7ILI1_APIME|nr:histone-lysine N-methyltransferase SETMAR-like [Apis mellifera]KAG9434271.1 histone-lysine N-methyltransferase SETMAR-like [Apis mellifera carnica]|eukprot:XP_016772665.2 histone-lysine N-methyltransferase SETMAR-like [Apis mellifera]